MTKVGNIIAKCAKCGNESSQMVVYSVNFSLGDKDANDNLMKHKQKCPYCGYEAVRIDTVKEDSKGDKLKRETLIKLTDDFLNKTDKYNNFEIPNELYLEYFNQVNELFNKCIFETDNRFVTYGRIDFLKKELVERLKEDDLKNSSSFWTKPWDNRRGAFWDLYDCIVGDVWLSHHNVPKELNFNEILLKNGDYYKDGFICKEERDILLDMIKEIKRYIQSKKCIYKISNHDWGIKTINSISSRTWYIYNDLSLKYEIINGEEKKKNFYHSISDIQLAEINKNIELAKQDNRKIEAFDGEAWEFIEYKEDDISWKRDLGYIYGITPLENIGAMLYQIVKNDSKIIDDNQNIEVEMNLFNNNYDVKPDDNVPQIVYGIPDFMREKENEENNTACPYCGSTELYKYLYGEPSIDYDKDKYILGGCEISLNNPQYKCKKCNKDINFNNIYDVDVEDNIPREVYGIPDALRNKYDIDPKNNIPQKVYGVPNNFVINKPEIEKVRIGIEEGQDNYALSFDAIVKNKVNDIFWERLIIDYFREELKVEDSVANIIFSNLIKADEIFNEFTKYLTQKTYDIKDAIEINGYTAKKIAELNPTLNASEVYSFLVLLKDNKKNN